MTSCAEANYPLIDGRMLAFDSAGNNFNALMFTEKTLAVFDESGAVPTDNLVTESTFDNNGAAWNVVTVGDDSSVTFAEFNARLLPQAIDLQLVTNGDFTFGNIGWTVDTDFQAIVNFVNDLCELIGGNDPTRFARIKQSISTTIPGGSHAISALVSGVNPDLRIGTSDNGSDILDVPNWDGSAVTFTPPGNDFFLTLESQGNTQISVVDSITIKQNTAGTAAINQEVTTAQPGVPHAVRINVNSSTEYRIQVGTAAGDGSYVDQYTTTKTYEQAFTPAGNYWITVTADGATSPEVSINNLYSWVISDSDDIAFNTLYLNDELRDLYFVAMPEANTAYVLHPNHPPYKISRDTSTGIWNWVEVVFTAPPSDWAEGNYPACGDFFQGRLFLAATYTSPQTVWASASGERENFGPSSDNTDPGNTVIDSDGLVFTIAKFGKIRWMISTRELLLGTINGEHRIYSAGDLITPNDVQVDQQSSYGSKMVQPQQIGDQIMYVSPDGRKLRAMAYDWRTENWLSRDLLFVSEHLTADGAGIRSIAWNQYPDQLLWCALEDGTAICLTYERGENIYGWHRHDTQGCFREFASGIAGGESFLLALIQRERGELALEVQEPDSHFDSNTESVAAGGAGATTTVFFGFDHLISKQVQVLLDGAVHPDVLVANDGSITTLWEGRVCEAGLQFTPRLVTLPFDKGAPGGQSGQTFQKRYNKLEVTLLDSALPIINGELQPDRTPATPMDTREPDSDGLARTKQILLGWDQDATVIIEQPLPLACTVLSIAGELAMKKL